MSSSAPRPKPKKPGRSTPAKPTGHESTSFGSRLIAGMEDLVNTLTAGGMAAVEKKFTVKRVRRVVFDRPTLTAADVAAIRADLGVSPPEFAALLGVSLNTIHAWEQGETAPSGMAVRFLAEIRCDPAYWKSRVMEATGQDPGSPSPNARAMI